MNNSSGPPTKIPRAYDFVLLTPVVRRRARPEARLDRRVAGTLSGRIRLSLTTEQPVHVGSGTKVLEGDKVVRTCVQVQGRPGIPGSSLKGLLRSRYEAMTQSCAGVTQLQPRGNDYREGIRSSSGVQQAVIPANVMAREAVLTHCQAPLLCPACALFGHSTGRESLRSRITVLDLVMVSPLQISGSEPRELHPIPEQFAPNLHHLGKTRRITGQGQDFFEVQSLEGRKFALSNSKATVNAPRQAPRPDQQTRFWLEVMPAKASLQGELTFQNLLPEELGGLLTALGLAPASYLKVGAAKALGLGRTKVTLEGLEVFDERRRPVSWALSELRVRFERWQDRFEVGEKQLIELHQGGC